MSTITSSNPTSEPASRLNRWWEAQFWVGADCLGWLRLLARNRFDVDLKFAHIAAANTFYTVLQTPVAWTQRLVYGRRIDATRIDEPPLFILGHWRTGTTLLHELLILDDRHTFANTWQCFAPNHFLLSGRLGPKLLPFLLPAQRPMDNMPLGWSRPQEDEFALCNLGVPSPYLSIAFPNHRPQYPEYLDLVGLSPRQLARWQRALLRFLKQVYLQSPKRIVLKSPPHTARIPALLELFPEARFVYLVRDPVTVFPSTMHLWRSLFRSQGLQTPKFAGLEEYVFTTFNRLHTRYEQTRHLIAPNRLYELRYEDLVRDPLSQMQSLYEQLELGNFEPVRPAIARYFAEQRNYQTNRYQISDELRDEIRVRWHDYIERHGYSGQPATV